MSAAGIYESLELLNDVRLRRGLFIHKVEEQIEHKPGILSRYTRVHLQIPHVLDKPTSFSSDLPFVYVLRAPRRGQLWSVSDIDVSPSSGHRILGHDEHVLYSKALIAARYWSLCDDWALGDMRARAESAVATCNSLMTIPDKRPKDAAEIVDAQFEDGLLRILREYPRQPDLERRLHGLCTALTSRYFVCLAFNCDVGDSIVVEYVSEDQVPDIDHNFRTRESSRSHLRMALGGAPSPICFHAPLARVTPLYDVRLQTLPSAYIHSQVFLERRVSDGDVTRYVTIPEPDETGVRTWRRPTGTSTAHLLLANGNRTLRPVYVGMKVFERLPGSAGRATFIAVCALGISSLLSLARWISGGSMTGDAAALVVAALAVVTFGADALATWDPAGYVAVRSRVSQLLSSALLFLFSVWLLLPSGAGDGGTGVVDWFGRWSLRVGWILVLGAMLANAVWIWSRFRESSRQYVVAAQP